MATDLKLIPGITTEHYSYDAVDLMTAQDLEAKVAAGELTKLHTSYVRAYVSRKSGEIVRPYKGKFGTGFALLSPNWDSSRYSYITYYVS